MKTLYIERSVDDGSRGDWVEGLDTDNIDRIVVGTGPGSFAGIRAAIAFAQGYAIGRPSCEVLGLPSPCALAEVGIGRLAVVGDARRGLFWIAIFTDFSLDREIFQVDREGLVSAVPADCCVITPDESRIGALLAECFGERYGGGSTPTDEGLRRFAEANPAMLRPEPLPIYLNPAVRG